jgi:hypothetical protein
MPEMALDFMVIFRFDLVDVVLADNDSIHLLHGTLLDVVISVRKYGWYPMDVEPLVNDNFVTNPKRRTAVATPERGCADMYHFVPYVIGNDWASADASACMTDDVFQRVNRGGRSPGLLVGHFLPSACGARHVEDLFEGDSEGFLNAV